MTLNSKIKIKANCQDITDGGTMKCPRCGQEMESGYLIIQATHGDFGILAMLIKWNTRKIEHGIAGLDGGEVLFASSGFFKFGNIEAYRCSSCQVVTFEYILKGQGGVGDKEFQEEYKSKDYSLDDVEKYLR